MASGQEAKSDPHCQGIRAQARERIAGEVRSEQDHRELPAAGPTTHHQVHAGGNNDYSAGDTCYKQEQVGRQMANTKRDFLTFFANRFKAHRFTVYTIFIVIMKIYILLRYYKL